MNGNRSVFLKCVVCLGNCVCVCVCVVSDPPPPTQERWSREPEPRPRARVGKETKQRRPGILRVVFCQVIRLLSFELRPE